MTVFIEQPLDSPGSAKYLHNQTNRINKLNVKFNKNVLSREVFNFNMTFSSSMKVLKPINI